MNNRRLPNGTKTPIAGYLSALTRLRLLDWLAIGAAITIIVAVSLHAYASVSDSGPRSVSIHTASESFEYPLSEDRTVTVSGPIGKTVVRIRAKQVRVLSDPGPQQICVRQGAISAAGAWLACLPNRVFIKINGEPSAAEVDAKTY